MVCHRRLPIPCFAAYISPDHRSQGIKFQRVWVSLQFGITDHADAHFLVAAASHWLCYFLLVGYESALVPHPPKFLCKDHNTPIRRTQHVSSINPLLPGTDPGRVFRGWHMESPGHCAGNADVCVLDIDSRNSDKIICVTWFPDGTYFSITRKGLRYRVFPIVTFL